MALDALALTLEALALAEERAPPALEEIPAIPEEAPEAREAIPEVAEAPTEAAAPVNEAATEVAPPARESTAEVASPNAESIEDPASPRAVSQFRRHIGNKERGGLTTFSVSLAFSFTGTSTLLGSGVTTSLLASCSSGVSFSRSIILPLGNTCVPKISSHGDIDIPNGKSIDGVGDDRSQSQGRSEDSESGEVHCW